MEAKYYAYHTFSCVDSMNNISVVEVIARLNPVVEVLQTDSLILQ